MKTIRFDHEKLHVYQRSLNFITWTTDLLERVPSKLSVHSQIDRASTSIPLNIAEGNGKATEGDRRRFFEIARGSALECGAVQDVLEACGGLSSVDNAEAKILLDRIVAMLTKLGQRGYSIGDEQAEYSPDRE